MMKPECSIVIPTHNCRDYLDIALAGIAMQTGGALEMLIVDDGSSDGTDEWLTNATARDPRIRSFRLEGLGPAAARNHGLAEARAPLVALLDADDLWWPGKLARQMAFHQARPDVAFSFTDYLHVDPAGGTHGTCFEFWKPRFANRADEAYAIVRDAELEILAANIVGTSTVIASTDALRNANGFPADTISAEDWQLWLSLTKVAPVACSSAVTMSYLMRPNSLTQNRSSRIAAMREIVAPYRAREDSAARKAVRRADARIHVAEAEVARQTGRYRDAALAHANAFIGKPDRRTARAALADLFASLKPRGSTHPGPAR